MAKAKKRTTSPVLKKRRTREHVIADLSVNFVQRMVLKCGYTVQEYNPDYGYDLRIDTFDAAGGLEDECVHLQLKATDRIAQYALRTNGGFSFPVDVKDYRLWTDALMPVFLIIYDAILEEGYWLHIQDYAHENSIEAKGTTISVHIPQHQVLGIGAVRLMRERKQHILAQLEKGVRP